MSKLSDVTGKLVSETLNNIEYTASNMLRDIGIMSWEYNANRENPNQKYIDEYSHKLNELYPKYRKLISDIHEKAKLHPEMIPKDTIYCYTGIGSNTKVCPYWTQSPFHTSQNNGICMFLNLFDSDDGMGLVWDQCKSCGISEGLEQYEG
jgi:hypothetical protein